MCVASLSQRTSSSFCAARFPDLKFGGNTFTDGLQSTFCFIPYGLGWGNRISMAMLQACIPVVGDGLLSCLSLRDVNKGRLPSPQSPPS